MNSAGTDMYYSQHMSAGQPPPPQTVSSGPMTHYAHQQPSILQSGPPYPSPAPSYHHPFYSNGMTSPSGAQPMTSSHGVQALPGLSSPALPQNYDFDTTGQKAPNGMKPRVTATLWEDEGSLCFQVEAKGICVARREDNRMINGTKLLNVAGMTRGRRDGILKSEKTRHVVKIGPMHLKGVWIPFERALEFANKEKITELLYPLFVHNISALIYNPNSPHATGAQARVNQVMAADRRRDQQMRNSNHSQQPLPSLGPSHYPLALPAPPEQNTLPSQSTMARPTLDRAHTFPTPPASTPDGYAWAPSQTMSGTQTSSPMAIDTSLSGSSSRSMPNTPAATPPSNNMQTMQPYSQSAHSFENSRSMYAPQPAHPSSYQGSGPNSQERSMYVPSGSGAYVKPEISPGYIKSEMGPPSSRPSASSSGPVEQRDETKPTNGILHGDQSSQHVNQAADDDHDQEHEAEYTHNSDPYDGAQSSYNYSTTQTVGSLSGDHSHISPEMTGSPGHPPGSGRATPRTAPAPQPYYSQQGGYSTPPRVPQQSSNLYSVMNDRGAMGGPGAGEVYTPQGDMSGTMVNGYPAPGQMLNGSAPTGTMKRSRDRDDDDDNRPNSSSMEFKRRKTMEPGVGSSAFDTMNRNQTTTVIAPRGRR